MFSSLLNQEYPLLQSLSKAFAFVRGQDDGTDWRYKIANAMVTEKLITADEEASYAKYLHNKAQHAPSLFDVFFTTEQTVEESESYFDYCLRKTPLGSTNYFTIHANDEQKTILQNAESILEHLYDFIHPYSEQAHSIMLLVNPTERDGITLYPLILLNDPKYVVFNTEEAVQNTQVPQILLMPPSEHESKTRITAEHPCYVSNARQAEILEAIEISNQHFNIHAKNLLSLGTIHLFKNGTESSFENKIDEEMQTWIKTHFKSTFVASQYTMLDNYNVHSFLSRSAIDFMRDNKVSTIMAGLDFTQNDTPFQTIVSALKTQLPDMNIQMDEEQVNLADQILKSCPAETWSLKQLTHKRFEPNQTYVYTGVLQGNLVADDYWVDLEHAIFDCQTDWQDFADVQMVRNQFNEMRNAQMDKQQFFHMDKDDFTQDTFEVHIAIKVVHHLDKAGFSLFLELGDHVVQPTQYNSICNSVANPLWQFLHQLFVKEDNGKNVISAKDYIAYSAIFRAVLNYQVKSGNKYTWFEELHKIVIPEPTVDMYQSKANSDTTAQYSINYTLHDDEVVTQHDISNKKIEYEQMEINVCRLDNQPLLTFPPALSQY